MSRNLGRTGPAVAAVLAIVLALTAGAGVALAQAGAAVQFDGTNDYITFGRADSLGVKTFTLECWFMRTGAGATTSTGTGGVTAVPLLTKGRGEADGDNRDMNFFLGLRGTDSVLVADYEEGAGQTSAGLNHPINGVTRVRSWTWYHGAVTFDGTTLRLYLNGNLEATVSVGANRLPRWDSIQHAVLGSALTSTGVAAGYFAGVIDEARIWDRVMTQSAIRDSMLLPLTAGPGLRGRYGLDEGSGTAAANSVGLAGTTGTLTNGPLWVSPGTPFAFSNALRLGGPGSHVTFGNPAGLGLAQFTLECWFRRDSAGTATSTGSGGITAVPLLTKGRAEADGDTRDMNWFMGIKDTMNVLAADFEEGAAGATPGLNHPVLGVTPIGNGVWHHAAATYDGTTWRLYLDGRLENSLVVGQPPRFDSAQPAALGTAITSLNVAAGYLIGALDEVRVWDHARSQVQIQAAINSRIIGLQGGLAARWGLDEGAGTVVRSTAGTAMDGAIQSTPWTWTWPAPFNLVVSPPAAPGALVATAPNPLQAHLAWADNSGDESGFDIQRSTAGAGGPFTPLVSLPAGTTAYDDFTVTPGAEFCYRVRAYNAFGTSEWAGPACATTPAEPCRALDFDPTGAGTKAYVTLGNPAALKLPQFTLELWFRRDGAGTGTNTGTSGIPDAIPFIAKGRAEAENLAKDINYIFGIRASDSVLCADFEETTPGPNPSLNHPVAGATPIGIGPWHHAAATYDGNEWRLYLDGRLDGSLVVGRSPALSDVVVSLATALDSGNNPSGWFDGVLDEVRVWNVARSETQIQAGVNAQLTTWQPGLVGRWAMDELTGTLAIGSAGTGINGSIVGSAGSNWARVACAPFDLDLVPPEVQVLHPNGGEMLVIGTGDTLRWTAGDDVGVTGQTLLLSRDLGANWDTLVALPGDARSWVWTVSGPPVQDSARVRVVARDAAGNSAADESDAAFTILDISTGTLLALFRAEGVPGGIELRWRFGDPAAFPSVVLERAAALEGPWSEVRAERRVEDGVNVVLDADAGDGRTWYYRLVTTGPTGARLTFGPLGATSGVPVTEFALAPVAPNPAPGMARIEFALPVAARVDLRVLDVQGRTVTVLADGPFQPGRYQLTWNGSSERGRVPAGLYYVRCRAAGRESVRRLVLVR